MYVNYAKKIKCSDSFEQTFQIAKELGAKLRAPILIGLSGELGTGKTVFAKGIASGLAVKEVITSPTFLGVCEYYSGRFPFIHMDFYKKVVKIENLNSYLNENSIVLVEWVENFSSVFKYELSLDIRVYIQYLKDNEGGILENKREITIYRKN